MGGQICTEFPGKRLQDSWEWGRQRVIAQQTSTSVVQVCCAKIHKQKRKEVSVQSPIKTHQQGGGWKGKPPWRRFWSINMHLLDHILPESQPGPRAHHHWATGSCKVQRLESGRPHESGLSYSVINTPSQSPELEHGSTLLLRCMRENVFVWVFVCLFVGMGIIKVFTVILLLSTLIIDPVAYWYSCRFFMLILTECQSILP